MTSASSSSRSRARPRNEHRTPPRLEYLLCGATEISIGNAAVALAFEHREVGADLARHGGDPLRGTTLLEPGVDLLVKVIDVENILFGSEMVGAVRGIDPQTGQYFDDTKRYIDALPLNSADKQRIFEGNAHASGVTVVLVQLHADERRGRAHPRIRV